MTKELQFYLGGSVMTLLIIGIALFGFNSTPQSEGQVGQSVSTTPNFTVASSTTFTLTTTSQRLLATTTTGNGRRVGALIQPTGCTIATAAVFLNAEGSDAVATAMNGISVIASTTQAFSVFPGSPIVTTNAVQGITSAGTCSVLVTEWISQ